MNNGQSNDSNSIKLNIGGKTIIPEQKGVKTVISAEKTQSGSQKKKEDEEIKQISAKLNPELDQDLVQRIKKIPKRDRSRTYREALREYFKQHEEEKED
ncbi:hypothetical protein ACTFSJ_27710 [Bacillus cereus group sp. MYBK12-2]|uniref:hypothetical protein n=1 Tax=Bacillus cereus group sp. MYBK12-2 TaxID=3450689 RepID=UPI0032FEF1C4|nr:hypothetical protein [Bacillus pacificus]HDR7653593.1 hypothetical protein [Bacillus pacificus]